MLTTMLHAAKLDLTFDAARLQMELAALSSEPWEPHFNRDYYRGEWSGVALRSNSAGRLKIFIDPSRPLDYADTEAYSRSPYLRRCVSALPCPVRSVRLLKLGAGAEIREHRDAGISIAGEEARLHIPVITNDETEFIVGGRRVIMRPGECWYVNVDLPHSVTNCGHTDRVHLVIDVIVDEWLRSAVAASPTRLEILAPVIEERSVSGHPSNATSGVQRMHLGEMTIETFQPHVGSMFTVRSGDGREVSLMLVRVNRVMENVHSKKLKREPFALYFATPETVFLPQQTYSFSHPELGSDMPIFIVPIAREEGKYLYEAVFT
jgi:hypothetical protein